MKFLIFSLTVLVCITKINLHYRSLAVLAENGFQQIFSIQVSLPDRPVILSHFSRLICARVIVKVSITFDQVRKYLKVSQKNPD